MGNGWAGHVHGGRMRMFQALRGWRVRLTHPKTHPSSSSCPRLGLLGGREKPPEMATMCSYCPRAVPADGQEERRSSNEEGCRTQLSTSDLDGCVVC